MVEIGRFNTLTVVKIVDFGVYLDGGERGEILMPKEYVPANCFPDDEVKAFVYFDSEDRIVATTEHPHVMVGEFAFLKVVALSPVGAFLDWGDPMIEGKSYLVYAYLDKASDRIVASTKIDKYLDQVFPEYEPHEEVEVLIARKSDLGYNVIVNNMHWGLIYNNEIFQPLKIGQKMKGYIKEVREDEKIDVTLQLPGYAKIEGLAGMVLEKLKDYGGILDLSDKSEPEEIYKVFGCSKKNYKKALGTLLKQRLIEIGDSEVRLKTED